MPELTWCYVFIAFVFCLLILSLLSRRHREKRKARKVRAIAKGVEKLTPSQFFSLRNSYKGHLQDFDFMGCYIIHNLRNGKYYIGQATHVPQRVNAHLTGKGNGDVYADYRYGHPFEIQLIDITTTTYRRLDDMEREFIDAYDAYKRGYNRKRGNK